MESRGIAAYLHRPRLIVASSFRPMRPARTATERRMGERASVHVVLCLGLAA